VGERGAAVAGLETQDAALAARIEVAAHTVADLDRRLGQIDQAVEEAAKRGRTSAAVSAMESQRRARAGLAGERNEAAGTLAALKAERASVVAQSRQIETEAAPIRYVAELVGADTDSERAIRWPVALMVLCCDPLAIALTAAASATR
jgi:chromosome segregation ATPase